MMGRRTIRITALILAVICGLICLVGIFLPSFFLAIGPLHLWNWFRQHPAMRSVLKGVNAAVVGLLLAALYNPVWTSGILGPADFALGVVAFYLSSIWIGLIALFIFGQAQLGWRESQRLTLDAEAGANTGIAPTETASSQSSAESGRRM